MEQLPVSVSVTYGCPLCGKQGMTQAEATACRDNHQDPGRAEAARFLPGEVYPNEITIVFPNKSTGLYTLAGVKTI